MEVKTKCLHCGKEFSSPLPDKRKYCSQKCYWKDKKRRGLIPPSRKGSKISEEHKRKFGKANKGRKCTEETRKKMSLSKMGKKNSMYGRTGKDHPNWVGNKIKYFYKRIRRSTQYIQWRSNCFQRDNWSCQTCGLRGKKLVVHHIKGFAQILKDHKIKTFEQALNCKELWDRNNGVTLCEECHKLTNNYQKRI